jgi:adenosine kinase
MKYSSALDFARFKPKETIVTVSPGNLVDMINYPEICKAAGIDYIFDPGQALPVLDGEKLVRAIDGCLILMANDYEIELITAKTGLNKAALQKLAKAIIVTQGEFGSLVTTQTEECQIPAVKPKQAVDPTGCGDAYRGGLLSGLVHGKSLKDSAKMGSVCASFCVECYGTQDYRFSKAEFDERLNGI